MSTAANEDLVMNQYYAYGEAIFAAMQDEIGKAGLQQSILPEEPMRQATFNVKADPFSQQNALLGEFRDANGQKKGEILFHGDGSFYAEYDVVLPHPSKQRWFIECVTAWGKGEVIKTEMKLLPAV